MKTKSRRPVTKNSVIQQNVKNTPVGKTEPQEEMILQFGEIEMAVSAISEKVRQNYKDSGNETELKDIKIYIKPEEKKAYYVMNGETAGNVDLA